MKSKDVIPRALAEREDHIDVWRVLHAASDIPAWMAGDES